MTKITSISLTGHRPKELFGYNINSKDYDSIRNCLAIILKKYIDEYDEVTCHTGMALGADTLWADVSLFAKARWPEKIKVWADIPHPKQKDAWKNKAARDHYDFILSKVDGKTLYSNEYSPWCMQKRNEGMLDAGRELIAVWNGCLKPKSGTSNAIKYAIKNKEGYFVVRPNDNLIRWDKSNAMLTSKKGHQVYDSLAIKNYLFSLINEYKELGFDYKELNNLHLLAKNDKKIMFEIVHEVELPSYGIYTIKEYELKDNIFKNIKNHTFMKA